MEYEVKFLAKTGIISIKNEGRLNFKKARQYSTEAKKLAHLHNCNKYLIDHSETDLEHGVYKLHTDGAALEQFGLMNTDCVAVIVSNGRDTHFLNEKHPQETKWCSVKYFNNSEAALDWLTTDMK
jgi:hypothetical protein